ncbi:12882_t:CDS:1, partial [Acaulospora morrowiae]
MESIHNYSFGNVVFEIAKFAGKATLTTVAGASVVATGGLAAPLIGISVYAGGKIVKEISKDCHNKILENVGDIIEDIGIDGITSGLFSLGTKVFCYHAVQEVTSHGQEMIDDVKVMINTGEAIQVGSEVYDVYEENKDEIECLFTYYHDTHKIKTSFDDKCPICID